MATHTLTEHLRLGRKQFLNNARFADGIVETLREPLMVLDDRGTVLTANVAFYRTFNLKPDVTVERELHNVGDGQFNIPELRSLIEKVWAKKEPFWDYEMPYNVPGI